MWARIVKATLAYAHRREAAGDLRLIYDRDDELPYLGRIYVIPRWVFLGLARVVIHRFYKSDDPTNGLHNHKWPYLSVVLSGGYWEITEDGPKWYGPGSVLFRRASHLHRIELGTHNGLTQSESTYTLFIMGPRLRRDWQFKVAGVMYPQKEWLDLRAPGRRL